MDSAEVTIVWGEPCSLTATFTMVNESAQPRTVAVGFPMPIERAPWPRPDSPDPLSMSFNGREMQVHGPLEEEETSHTSRWNWYQCTNKFAPGATRVDVCTVLRASRVYDGPYTRTLDYCIRTGGKWAGRIGSERVTIHFPWPVVEEQLRSIRPKGSRIEGDRISWTFTDIEPGQDEFDIHIAFIQPNFMRGLTELRQKHEEQPESTDVAIRLAKQLLALGSNRSNAGHLPGRLTIEEFENIAARIKDPEDHAIFTCYYQSNFNGGYRAVFRTLVGEEKAIPRILSDAGYRDGRSLTGFVREGEELLLSVLEEDPHNAEAWNVYLSNYWRFVFGAMGRSWGPAWFGKEQVRAIERAAENCPDDATIKLWLKLCRTGMTKPKGLGQPGFQELNRSMRERGFREVELRSPDGSMP